MELLGINIAGRGKIVEVGERVPTEMNAPCWTPVRFADGTYAVLDSIGQPILFDDEEIYDTHIRDAAGMPRVSSLATGWSHICVDTIDFRKLSIRVGWGFGKEDEPVMHRWSEVGEEV